MDLTESIAPKSDQLNAEDLLSGPRTFTIDKVERGTTEQPVNVHLVEFPGRPFKPSKTVRRLMVAGWGKDTAPYTGRRMTLYRDPTVRFGGQDVGGIRVSHMSHLDKPLKIALTTTRGKRALFTVAPLPDDAPTTHVTPAPDVFTLLTAKGCPPDQQLGYIADTLGRTITGPDDLTPDDVALVTAALEAKP